MNYLTLDCNKLLSNEDLCLVGLSKVYISIEPELANKINLNTEELNSVPKCNNTTEFDHSFDDRDLVKSRMICCNVLQQALRWKPRPNSLLVTNLVKALNKKGPFNLIRGESVPLTGELLTTQSAGIARMLSTMTSVKVDSNNHSEVLQRELGLSNEEFNQLTNSYTEVLSNISILGTLAKTLANLCDLNLGMLCESMLVPGDFMLLPELQKIPNVMETVRNMMWLTEDSKLMPKKGGDKKVKSLVSSQVVLSGELRHLSESVLKEVSKIFTSLYSNVLNSDLQKVVDKAWNMTLKSHVNGLCHCLENSVSVYSELVGEMVSKYEEEYNQVLSSKVEVSETKELEKSVVKYKELWKSLEKREESLPKSDSVKLLESLLDLYNDYTNLTLSLSVNLLNLKEVREVKGSENKGKSNKQTGQKSILGHGNEVYKNFLEQEVFKGEKHLDFETWEKSSRLLQGSNLLKCCTKLESLLVPQNQKTRLPKLPKGTLDFMPNEMLTRRVIINAIKDIFVQHGAVEIDTPVFELKETLLGKYGEDQKLIFDLKDQGGEQLSMRYDLTVPFARFVALNKMEKIKRFHIGKVYRRDEPQLARGRYREFYQCDLDWAGQYPKMVPDAEVIYILVRVVRMLKGELFKVKVNHRVILDKLLLHCGVEQSMHRTICSSIDKLDKMPWEKVKQEMVNEKGLPEYIADKIKKYIEIKGTFEEVVLRLREHKVETLEEQLEEMELLSKYLKAFGVKDSELVFDMSLARGLDYYTGVIFEAVLEGEEVGSVGGGGRYDGLIGMFAGKQIPAVGMSVGIERLFRTMKSPSSGDLTDVFVCTVGSPEMFVERMKLSSLLWKEGVKAEYLYNPKANLRKQMDAAMDKNVSILVIVGDSEVENGTVKIKRMSYKDEERYEEVTVKREEMAKEVSRLLSQHTKYDHLTKTLFKE